MRITGIPFTLTDWSAIEPSEHKGERGLAHWRTQQHGELRVRMVEYSPGYLADHWCEKGHVVLCVAGELHTELGDGRVVTLLPGQSWCVADQAEAHRSYSAGGATLFIVD